MKPYKVIWTIAKTGYWLKLYYFWNDLDTTIFDPLDPLKIDESTQLNLFIKLDQLKTELKKRYEIEIEFRKVSVSAR